VNSPIRAARGRRRAGGLFSMELAGHGPPSLTIRPGRTGGMGGAGRLTPHRCWLICCPDAPKEPSCEAKRRADARRAAPRDGVLALAFHTLLSFQGAS
jgi:hypothetical protein